MSYGTPRPQSNQDFNDSLRQSFDHSTPAPSPRMNAQDYDLIDENKEYTHLKSSTLSRPLVSSSRLKKLPQHETLTNFTSKHLNNESQEMNSVGLADEELQSPRDSLHSGLASARSSRLSSHNNPGLNNSISSSAYARRKKELQTKMW